MRKGITGAAALGLFALVAASCGSSSKAATTTTAGGSTSSAASTAATTAAKAEGAVGIIAWAGYAEDGSTTANVDWVHPFEKATGCTATVKIANSSDEMVQLMATGGYDTVSASGDATLRLIDQGLVAAIDTSKIDSYADISPFLKNAPWNSRDGKMYGVPHGWGANLLVYNTDVVKPAPTSWSAVFDAASPYKGKLSIYDSPIYIADAAVYLKATQPDLKITNPYELTDTQFKAVVALLKTQRKITGQYWGSYADQQTAFDQSAMVLGTTWQVTANTINGDGKVKVDTLVPKEGSTGWSDTWMVAAKSAHPVCAYAWLNWITSAKIQAQLTENYGEAPANQKACDLTTDKGFCDTYHAKDAAYAANIAYWTTPSKDCLDSRGKVCVDYQGWTDAWAQIKG